MLKKVNFDEHTDTYWLNLTKDELQVISALLWKVRLGVGNKYKAAASTLSEAIEDCTGVLFLEDASTEVDPYFSVEDCDGQIASVIESPYSTIEFRGGEIA